MVDGEAVAEGDFVKGQLKEVSGPYDQETLIPMNRVSKKQKTSSDFYSSYGFASSHNDLYLFYDDNALNYHPKFKNQACTFTAAVDAESVLVVAKIDKAGTVTKDPIVSSYQTKVIQKPKWSFQQDDNSVLIFGQQGIKQVLNRFTIP